jgi:AcrR family transcriptional regulator
MSRRSKTADSMRDFSQFSPEVRHRIASESLAGRRRDGALTRAKLLETAMQEFAEKGLDARIEDISETSGTNRRMAYYYFGSKEGLYLAALEATYLELAEAEQAIDVDALGPIEAIAALVSAKFEHFVAHPRYVEFLKIENIYRGRHLKTSQRIDELRGPFSNVVKKVLKRGQELGVMRENVDSLELYIAICALGFFAFSNQYTLGAMFQVDLMTPEALQRRRQMMIDMVTAYLASGARVTRETPPRTDGSRNVSQT